jgi:hypothetical protein
MWFSIPGGARCRLKSMPSKPTDRQIEKALLAAAVAAGSMYSRRRAKRAVGQAKIAIGVAAGVGGIGLAIGLGATIAWLKSRSRARESAQAAE